MLDGDKKIHVNYINYYILVNKIYLYTIIKIKLHV